MLEEIKTVWDAEIPMNEELIVLLEDTDMSYWTVSDEHMVVTEYGIESRITGIDVGESSYVLDEENWDLWHNNHAYKWENSDV